MPALPSKRFLSTIEGEDMKSILVAVAAAGSLLVAGTASAQDAAELAKKSGCMNCHAVDTKKAGPALKDVAAKYKGNKEAEAKIVAALAEGKGHPKVNASQGDITAMVKWVLAM
jgi:cytochrome c